MADINKKKPVTRVKKKYIYIIYVLRFSTNLFLKLVFLRKTGGESPTDLVLFIQPALQIILPLFLTEYYVIQKKVFGNNIFLSSEKGIPSYKDFNPRYFSPTSSPPPPPTQHLSSLSPLENMCCVQKCYCVCVRTSAKNK